MSEDNDALSRVTHYTDTNGRLQMYPIDLSVGVKQDDFLGLGLTRKTSKKLPLNLDYGCLLDRPITKLWKRLKRWLKKDQ